MYILRQASAAYLSLETPNDAQFLLKDHNAVTPVRLEPAAPRSRVKHSTTEPLRSSTWWQK